MAKTRVEIISNAITLLGQAPITNLVNQSDLVVAAGQAFDLLLPDMLSTGSVQWRFATKIAALVNRNVTPIGGYWSYTYALPADYLKLVHLWPHNYNYEMYTGMHMYSNFDNTVQPLYMEYIFMPVVTDLPDYFVTYLVYNIAEYLSLSSAQNIQYASYLQGKVAQKKAEALAADAQNRPQTPLQSAPMITNRYVSSFVGVTSG